MGVCIYGYIYTYGLQQNYKKEWNFAIYNNMYGPGGHYAKRTKSDRERQILYYTTHMWNLNNKIKPVNITEQIHRSREQTSGHHGGGGMGVWVRSTNCYV